MVEDKLQVTNHDFLIYNDGNNDIKVRVMLINNDLWLTQNLIAELFDVDRSVITKHINKILNDGELEEKGNVQKMHIAKSDKPVKIYNLNVIIAVGYRVNSKKATNFRIWATKVLKEYFLFSMVYLDGLLLELYINWEPTGLFINESFVSMCMSIIGLELGTMFNIHDSREYNIVQKRISALLVQIGELNNKLAYENKKLNKLRQDKKVTLNQQVEDKEFQKNNGDTLQRLSSLESLWYQTGYRLNEYYGYEQEGTLRKMLHDEYTQNGELDEVERVTKKHGPVLAKKLTPQANRKQLR